MIYAEIPFGVLQTRHVRPTKHSREGAFSEVFRRALSASAPASSLI
jgi:hypothetical protein